jgi:cyclic pyranopterin phosphate synthase
LLEEAAGLPLIDKKLMRSVSGAPYTMVSSTDPKPLTHIGADGEARMVDVSDKAATDRVAIAEGRVRMAASTLRTILAGDAKKGDVIGAARIAGIMGAKKTADLIPLCHPVVLTKVSVDIAPDDALPGLTVRVEARCVGQTGVEMEALTAVSVACLTIYDMAKAIDRGMSIEGLRLIEKRGGKSGEWRAARERKDTHR